MTITTGIIGTIEIVTTDVAAATVANITMTAAITTHTTILTVDGIKTKENVK